MTVTTRPRRPGIEQDRDLEQRVADLELLIEEARRRARRRRGLYAAAVLTVIAAGIAAASGIGGGGGGVSLGSSIAKGSLRSPAAQIAATAVAPPKCSSAGGAAVTAENLPGHRLVSVSAPAASVADIAKWGFPVPAANSRLHYKPTYTRWCGPASALVRLHGASYRIRGGSCEETGVSTPPAPVERTYGFAVGLEGRAPAAPAKSLEFAVHYPPPLHPTTFRHPAPFYPGTFRLSRVDASIQLRGQRSAVPGTITAATVTIGHSLRAGTFAFQLRDATRITGSWTCG